MKRMTTMVPALGASAMLIGGAVLGAAPASAGYSNTLIKEPTMAACTKEVGNVMRDLRSQGLQPFMLAERSCHLNTDDTYTALVEWNM